MIVPRETRDAFLPLNLPHHRSATRPAPAAAIPPGSLWQNPFCRPGCLPVIFSSALADRRTLSTGYASADFSRAHRGENFFPAGFNMQLQPAGLRDFIHGGKTKPEREGGSKQMKQASRTLRAFLRALSVLCRCTSHFTRRSAFQNGQDRTAPRPAHAGLDHLQ